MLSTFLYALSINYMYSFIPVSCCNLKLYFFFNSLLVALCFLNKLLHKCSAVFKLFLLYWNKKSMLYWFNSVLIYILFRNLTDRKKYNKFLFCFNLILNHFLVCILQKTDNNEYAIITTLKLNLFCFVLYFFYLFFFMQFRIPHNW